MKQITNTIMMIEPVCFKYNHQTAATNYYQRIIANLSANMIQKRALSEFNNFVTRLKDKGINVIVIKDTPLPETPDSIFPNNWISFHSNGNIALYPMSTLNRQHERREDIFQILENNYHFYINEIKDFTEFESKEKYLEGTGSMVLDRDNRICYAAISLRTDKEIVIKFCKEFHYTPIFFTAKQTVGQKRKEIYHTNVMMCIADQYAIICLESIDNLEEKELIIKSLNQNKKEIIEISEEQKFRFAGNMLQIIGDEKYLVMSESAFNSLSLDQKIKIEKFNSIIYSNLDTIEACGGGSARCMMAEIFLPKKN